jgi:predicted ATPase
VRLDPLPPAHADKLLQALAGEDLSLTPLKHLLIARTEGNPFFLEERVRTLVETQALVGETGAYCLAQALPAMLVPATVQAVLAARIDRLPVEEKRLLQTAAVVGHAVPGPLLRAIAERPEAVLHRSLAHLQAAEFLYEAWLFPEAEYTFKHALTHEVAYGSLLQERRRILHAGIVEAIEAAAGDRLAEQVERLAHHTLRGAVWDKASHYAHQAGTRAADRAAYAQAGTFFDQALDALAHLPESQEMIAQAILSTKPAAPRTWRSGNPRRGWPAASGCCRSPRPWGTRTIWHSGPPAWQIPCVRRATMAGRWRSPSAGSGWQRRSERCPCWFMQG